VIFRLVQLSTVPALKEDRVGLQVVFVVSRLRMLAVVARRFLHIVAALYALGEAHRRPTEAVILSIQEYGD
jgi:hypothetical protein